MTLLFSHSPVYLSWKISTHTETLNSYNFLNVCPFGSKEVSVLFVPRNRILEVEGAGMHQRDEFRHNLLPTVVVTSTLAHKRRGTSRDDKIEVVRYRFQLG